MDATRADWRRKEADDADASSSGQDFNAAKSHTQGFGPSKSSPPDSRTQACGKNAAAESPKAVTVAAAAAARCAATSSELSASYHIPHPTSSANSTRGTTATSTRSTTAASARSAPGQFSTSTAAAATRSAAAAATGSAAARNGDASATSRERIPQGKRLE